jgi:UDP-3-O-[3-hydroxymyristoyl] N-acetylglucosamine deacetylase
LIRLERHQIHHALPGVRWDGQNTSAWIEGVGLHTGAATRVRFRSTPGEAVRIVCDGVRIPLLAEFVRNTQLATQIGFEGVSVSTTEHLLAALHILGHWTGFEIEVEGPEIPILDGSALGWALVLQHVTPESAPIRFVPPEIAVEVRGGYVGLENIADDVPAQLNVSIGFAHPDINDQRWIADELRWLELLDARTFAFAHDLERLLATGRGMGFNNENAIVFSKEGPSLPLRGFDEPVRHKALDLLGDLYLVGKPLQALVVAERPSHEANVALALELRSFVRHA